jgi:hypothetical protein
MGMRLEETGRVNATDDDIRRARRSLVLSAAVTLVVGIVMVVVIEGVVGLVAVGVAVAIALYQMLREYREPSNSLKLPPGRVVARVLARGVDPTEDLPPLSAEERTGRILDLQDELDQIVGLESAWTLKATKVSGMLGAAAFTLFGIIALIAGHGLATTFIFLFTGGGFGAMGWWFSRFETRRETAVAILEGELEAIALAPSGATPPIEK